MEKTTTVAKEVQKFETALKARNLAKSTVVTYSSIVRKFLRHYRTTPKRISSQQITEWMAQHGNGATKAQIRGALLNYYSYVVGQPRKFDSVPVPQREKTLPVIMAQEEVVKRISKIRNLKHRAIISVLYGAGLRRSELRISDIDKFRRTIHIHAGKGAKDRIVPVSEKLLVLLREYYRQYQPQEFLFEGQKGGRYSSQSMLKICYRYMNVNPHNLRHCHATHLIENGVDVSEVSKRLGHTKLQTTMVYNHIATTHNPVTLLAA